MMRILQSKNRKRSKLMSTDTNNMSDEELLEHIDSLPVEDVDNSESTEAEAEVEEEIIEEEESEQDLEDTEAEDETEEVDDTTEDTLDTDETEDDDTDKESQTEVEDSDEEESNEDTDEDTQETSEIDYKAFYEEVTSDYKANGKEMPGIKDPKDFKTALSMASNYALKTSAIKPHMARIKMLEGVTDEELNEMMDFKNRNPEAIKKALKEAGIDPLDIDDTEESTYQPTDHRISDSELEFEEAIEPIKNTPEFVKTTEVVTKVWDQRSKNEMLENPQLLVALNAEIQMGRYDIIQGHIDQAKLLGKDNGRSDLEMYQEIATIMNQQAAAASTQTDSIAPLEKPKTKVTKPATKAQKQAAGINTKKSTKVVKKYDPATLSDAEFNELMAKGAKFISN